MPRLTRNPAVPIPEINLVVKKQKMISEDEEMNEPLKKFRQRGMSERIEEKELMEEVRRKNTEMNIQPMRTE